MTITELLGSLPTKSPIRPTRYARVVSDLLVATLVRRHHTLPLAQSLGRILAQDIRAQFSVPSFANSQMDGYALTGAASTRSRRIFTVGADIAAGTLVDNLEINDDIAYPIMTGAALPEGYEAVVPLEQSRPLSGPVDEAGFAAQGEDVELAFATAGQFVRQVGEDLSAGDLLARAGCKITPALIGALATQGLREVEVYAPVRLLVLTGGNELKASTNSPLEKGTIFDSNGPMLQALAHEDGCVVHRLLTGDSPENLTGLLAQALVAEEPDLIITSGGISRGKYEVVRKGIEKLAEGAGGAIGAGAYWFGHVSQQPGGPQGLALLSWQNSETPDPCPGQLEQPAILPVICLPGNPVSTLISYHLLIRPALGRLHGKEPEKKFGTLVLDEPVRGPTHKTQFRRAKLSSRLTPTGARQVLLEPDAATGSHLLHRAAQAQALVELEAGITYRGGETVRYYDL